MWEQPTAVAQLVEHRMHNPEDVSPAPASDKSSFRPLSPPFSTFQSKTPNTSPHAFLGPTACWFHMVVSNKNQALWLHLFSLRTNSNYMKIGKNEAGR